MTPTTGQVRRRRLDVDLPLQVRRHLTGQQYAILAHFADKLPLARSALSRQQARTSQPLSPVRGERGVRRARHRVLADPDVGAEPPRDEVDAFTGRGYRHTPPRESTQSAE